MRIGSVGPRKDEKNVARTHCGGMRFPHGSHAELHSSRNGTRTDREQTRTEGEQTGTEGEQTVTDMRWTHGCYALDTCRRVC